MTQSNLEHRCDSTLRSAESEHFLPAPPSMEIERSIPALPMHTFNLAPPTMEQEDFPPTPPLLARPRAPSHFACAYAIPPASSSAWNSDCTLYSSVPDGYVATSEWSSSGGSSYSSTGLNLSWEFHPFYASLVGMSEAMPPAMSRSGSGSSYSSTGLNLSWEFYPFYSSLRIREAIPPEMERGV
ncbi:hypothetical protein D9611_002869 [Ephemerocybe angulata]|uniref:Uncharacterized protein n=1 Tax=Ephemerocybe angulata TaxID=980116 RepID=A0A8H5CAD0_9AGAR|nr:hypothetical protein D9611_002869 [Tulosesus angulatus]